MNRHWFYIFFLVSGFCSLTFEVIWLRVAMAKFGVTTPFVSIVLSVFMAGIAIGSYAGGRVADKLRPTSASLPLLLYAGCELTIGIAGLLIPSWLEYGRQMVNESTGAAWGSGMYHLISGAWIALILIPATACMGATIPVAMAAIRLGANSDERSFSFLYASNVLGAMTGTMVSAFVLIEVAGFRGASWTAASLNGLLAIAALVLSQRSGARPLRRDEAKKAPGIDAMSQIVASGWSTGFLLFTLGLASLGLEVVWTRQFTPYLGTVVYAFSGTLGLYLGATFVGSTAYRRWAQRNPGRHVGRAIRLGLLAVGAAGLLPVIVSDPRFPLPLGRGFAPVRLLIGVVPFCAIVGFLSPMLIDRWSKGDPERAGNAYAINTVGCILGPLLGSFILLPWLSERWAVLVFLLPFVLFATLFRTEGSTRSTVSRAMAPALSLLIVLVAVVTVSADPETLYPSREVRRDSTATVVAATVDGHKHLFVNGQGMVYLTPVTKMMAHLPLAFRQEKSQRALVVCLGMATTLRSLRSWDIDVTGVELVPSVPSLFGYFYADASALLQSPQVHVEIDDGRRFLERSRGTYDVITIDPPPPVEAAGSSLLYSTEWYALVKKRLSPGGVLQQWLPYGDLSTITAATKSVVASFRYVRVFNSFEGWGFHILASDEPIPSLTAAELAARLPSAAAADLVEIGPLSTPEAQFAAVLDREVPLAAMLGASPDIPLLTDDRPINEYYLWRRSLFEGWSLYFSYKAGAFVAGRD